MSTSTPLKILCTGDLHLGRRPTRTGSDAPDLTVAHVWDRIVDAAIDFNVDLVALTGDLVDRENRYFEALGPLERGLQRLSTAGIPIFAVAGNHDFDVLPRLADVFSTDHFHLLGRGGQWESRVFKRQGAPALEILGWSFPSQYVEHSPVATFPTTRGDLPAIALLHADLDQVSTPYAPIRRSELEQIPLQAWLLGHIHRPMLARTTSQGVILYPGSPQALHPGETGTHGPWLITISPQGFTDARQLPLATVRYQELIIDLSDAEEPSQLHTLLPQTILADLKQLRAQSDGLSHVVYRITLSGRTKLHRHLNRLILEIDDQLALSFENLQSTIDSFQIRTTPTFDLHTLAGGSDPPGALATLLLEIQNNSIHPTRQPLFDALQSRLREIHGSNAFAPLLQTSQTEAFLTDAELQEIILHQGLSLLDELLTAKAESAR